MSDAERQAFIEILDELWPLPSWYVRGVFTGTIIPATIR